jgi:hypothetical protein
MCEKLPFSLICHSFKLDFELEKARIISQQPTLIFLTIYRHIQYLFKSALKSHEILRRRLQEPSPKMFENP